ncbi:hypothetical protein [Streptomyces sp. NPDC005262]|uniref:hypothetical protein n=1 Tax=Streptomyces sp. NPDC005262 TaxID=3364710 RepID=UPI0036952825
MARGAAEAELPTAAATGRAGKLLDAVVLPADLPAPLATRWGWCEAKHLQGAIAGEEMMGKEGKTDQVLASVTEMAAPGYCRPPHAERVVLLPSGTVTMFPA